MLANTQFVLKGPDMDMSKLKEAHVLYVEDNPINQSLMKNILNDLVASYAHASDGREGLELLQHDEQINIVLTDLNMPGIDGEEMIEKIKAMGRQVPIIIVSSYTDVSRVQGVQGMIEKPFKKEKILQAITNCLI